MDLQQLVLRIKGDSSGAESALGKVQSAASKFGGIVKAVIAGVAVAAMVKFGESCINAAAESQSAESLLRNSLGNVKGMTDKAKDSAVAWVNSMEKSKAFDDADISAALQRVIVKTGDLKTSEEYLSVAMEVARNKHMDLASATALLDTAYNGSARGLKQFGIEAQEGAKGIDYLRQIQDKVRGSGDAWAKTLEGQREVFKTTFGNFQESVGRFLMPIATKFMEVIQPFLQKGMSWIADHLPQIQAVIDTLVKGISWVVETAGKMYGAIKPFIVSITEAMGPYVKSLFDWLGSHGIALQSVLVGVARGIGAAFTIVAAVIKGIVDAIKWVIDNIGKALAWSKEQGAKGANAGGVYSPPVAVVPSIGGHASGGWVGLNGPEIALVGERGPEYVMPAGQTGANDSLLRELIREVHALRRDTAQQTRGFAQAVQGMAR